MTVSAHAVLDELRAAQAEIDRKHAAAEKKRTPPFKSTPGDGYWEKANQLDKASKHLRACIGLVEGIVRDLEEGNG